MTLHPVATIETPSYPRRRGGATAFGLSLRRALGALIASGALCLGGCYGATAVGPEGDDDNEFDFHSVVELTQVVTEQPPLPDWDDEDMAGGMRAPAFECGQAPEWGDYSVPSYLEGYLCGDQPSVGTVEVTAEGAYEVAIATGEGLLLVEIYDPGDALVAELGPDQPSVTLDMTVGNWTLVVTPADPEADPSAWFAIEISPASP